MQKGFQKIIEGIAWLQIAASPLLIGALVGLIVGITINAGLGIIIGLIGLVIGISWATRVSKKEGTSHYMSRIIATPELDGKDEIVFMKDIICQVYAGNKSLQKIKLVLNEFLPDYESLNLDYAAKMEDESYVFKSESEMLGYFIDTPNVQQTFYWNQVKNNPDRIMVGANITTDNQLVMSLTVDGTPEIESLYLNKLKTVLHSEISVVSYVDPADYDSGEDFCNKYR
jgi:hypothetical protein